MIQYITLASFYLSSLTHAVTEEDKGWGLMGKTSIEEREGMLFHYPDARQRGLWMYNCYVPLDVAFLDERGTILEIESLPCFPEVAKLAPQVKTPEEVKNLNPNDPFVRFFLDQMLVSKVKARYVLEVKAGFFASNQIKTGMRLHWDESKNLAWIDNE